MDRVFDKYRSQFIKQSKNKRLTEYESAFGFNESSRVGAKQFSIRLGHMMEDIYNCSDNYIKIRPRKLMGGCDGYNDTTLFEVKNRHDTMKGSNAYNEILPKLQFAIAQNKDFKLMILIDKKNITRDCPIHEISCLKRLQYVDGYDPSRHRWVSGDNIFKLLFGDNWKTTKASILVYLSSLKNRGCILQ